MYIIKDLLTSSLISAFKNIVIRKKTIVQKHSAFPAIPIITFPFPFPFPWNWSSYWDSHGTDRNSQYRLISSSNRANRCTHAFGVDGQTTLVNNLLKLSIDWRLRRLSELVDRQYSVVQIQTHLQSRKLHAGCGLVSLHRATCCLAVQERGEGWNKPSSWLTCYYYIRLTAFFHDNLGKPAPER